MKEYLVRSGQMTIIVKAKNLRDAAEKAIKKDKPKSLGLIIEITEIPNEETVYTATKSIVEIKET